MLQKQCYSYLMQDIFFKKELTQPQNSVCGEALNF